LCGLQNEQVCSFHLLNRPRCCVVSRILVFERSEPTCNKKDGGGALGMFSKHFDMSPLLSALDFDLCALQMNEFSLLMRSIALDIVLFRGF
jgi:hypothetical protein